MTVEFVWVMHKSELVEFELLGKTTQLLLCVIKEDNASPISIRKKNNLVIFLFLTI